MKRLLLLALAATNVWAQTSLQPPVSLQVLRGYGITSATQYIDERAANRQANYHSFCATGTGTWSVQMEYSDTSSLGPWTSFGSPAVVTNSSANCVGSGLGYHPFIRLNTTVGSTSSTYTSWKDAYTSALGSGGGGGGGTIGVTTNVLKGDNAGNAISAGFAGTNVGVAGLFCTTGTGSKYLGDDGNCHNAAGSGTVTSVGASETNDTNVTLTLTGTNPVTTSGTIAFGLGWTGTLAAGRLNSSVVQGITNDTNVTGSIATQNLTLGWTGTLAAGRLNSNVVQSVVNDTNLTGSISAQALTFAWAGTLAAGRLNANVVQAVTNDTNIHGAISAQNITFSWAGTLAAARLNSNVVQSVVNDTNVTGSIAAQALTLGWTGLLAGARMTTMVGDGGSGGVKGAVPAPAAGDAAADKFLKADGTWAAPAGAGTVTVVGGGNLGNTALVTGGGAQTLQTPDTSATMDSSGNISTPGTIRTGVGGMAGGFSDYGAGTAHTATGVGFQAPVTVSSPFMFTLPGAPAGGLMRASNATPSVISIGELSQDATTSGSNVVTVVGINNTLLSGLATGLLRNTTTTGIPSIATAAQILAACTVCAPLASPTFTGTATQPSFNSTTNCANSATPAVCGSAAAGAVAIPTGITTVTLTVNTSAVTANSRILLTSDDSLTIAATTCNSTLATLVGGMAVTARTPGTSFAITYNGTIATNPLCVSYLIVN